MQARDFHRIGIEFSGMPNHYRLQQASSDTVLFEIRTVLQATRMANAVLHSADEATSTKTFNYVVRELLGASQSHNSGSKDVERFLLSCGEKRAV